MTLCQFHYNKEYICRELITDNKLQFNVCKYHTELLKRKWNMKCAVISGNKNSFQFICNNKCDKYMFCNDCYEKNKKLIVNTIAPIPIKNIEYVNAQKNINIYFEEILYEYKKLLEKYQNENKILKIQLHQTTKSYIQIQTLLNNFLKIN